MKIAIFGDSGSGKSVVSTALAYKLNIDLRGCGDEVKKLATSKGISFPELSNSDHLNIDAQTIEFAQQRDDWVIEGRFLDQVLVDLEKPFFLIRLVASPNIRASRLELRSSRATTPDDVHRYDAEDVQFRGKMYAYSNPLQANHIIQCDELSVSDVVDEIYKRIGI